MARSSAILQSESNQAPQVAQITLCVLAVACVASAVIGIRMGGPRSGIRTEADIARMEAAMLSSATPRTADGGRLPATLSQIPPPTFPGATAPAPAPAMIMPGPSALERPGLRAPATGPVAGTPPTAAPTRPALPLNKQLKNPQAMEAVMAARVMREQGNMQAAIESLKSADVREPNHPEIIGEMALVYEDMGLSSRAETYWRQIYTMGEANAGGYYTLAASKIGNRGGPAAAATTTEAPGAVSLGPCRLSREPLAKQGRGERIILRVPILVAPGATINPSKLAIHATLYESVNNGEKVEAVPQGQTSQTWSTQPLNWSEVGREAVDVTYDLLTQKADSPGTRSFHGYVVSVYYMDKLAGEQAQPESLREGAQKRTTPAGPDNALFPK